MKNWQLFKASFTNFPNLKEARKTPFWKVIIYLLLLSIIMAIPMTKQLFSILSTFHEDCTKIAKKIPDFKIEDGKLITDDPDAEGFIYQTDTIVFTFDPQGKRSDKEIASDLVGNFVSLGFTKDKFIFSTADSEVTTALLGSNSLDVPYTNEALKGLDSKQLKQMLTESGLPAWGYLVMFLLMVYPVLFNLITTLLIATLGSFIYTKMRRLKITLFESMKIMVYCLTFPVVVASVIMLIIPNFDVTMVAVLISMFIFFQAVKGIEPKEPGEL